MVAVAGAPLRADRLRPLSVPRPIRVVADARGRPTLVALQPRIQKRVAEILDHWRIDDEWWRQEIVRRYFHVMLEGGRPITVFHDLVGDGWFVQTTATPVQQPEPLTVLAPVATTAVVVTPGVEAARRIGVA